MTIRMAVVRTGAGGMAIALATGLAAALATGGGPAAASAQASYAGGGFRPPAQQIVCESQAFRRQDCPADARGGVRLLQQTGGLCTRGATWGFDPRGIWVDNGCRAIFAVVGGAEGGGPGGGAHPSTGRLIVCSSYRQPARCPAQVTRRPRIEVIAGRCSEHRTWGWDRRGIWVSGGCRARFLLG